MARLIVAPSARIDLKEILNYISRDKPDAAMRWVAKIRVKFKLLAQNPHLGECRPDFKNGECRSSLVGNYVIFYRPIDGGVEIARVVRGERDVRQLE